MVAYLNNNEMLTNYVLALYILSFFHKATKLATYSLIGIAYNYILITLPKELHYKISRHNLDCCYSDLSEFFDNNLKIDGKIPVGSPSIVSHIFSVSSSIFSFSVGFISIFFASM